MFGVDVVQTRDFRVLVLHEGLPVECTRSGTVPAIPFGFRNLSRITGGEHHELLRNATDVDAGTADGGISRRTVLELSLEEGHLGSVARGDAGGTDAARSYADDEEVVVIVVLAGGGLEGGRRAEGGAKEDLPGLVGGEGRSRRGQREEGESEPHG